MNKVMFTNVITFSKLLKVNHEITKFPTKFLHMRKYFKN